MRMAITIEQVRAALITSIAVAFCDLGAHVKSQIKSEKKYP